MLKINLFFFLSAFPLLVFANARPRVVFFGGQNTTDVQTSCWKRGAQFNALSDGYSFDHFAYPEKASTDRDKAIAASKETIDKVLGEIKADPKRKIVLVGHSAGSAIAIAVAEKATKKKKYSKYLQLVTLDGFTPSPKLQKKLKTVCMYAVNKSEGIESNNAARMREACGKNAKTYEDLHCKTKECLHYTLVNKRVLPQFIDVDDAVNGYLGCESNLDVWLPPAKDLPVKSKKKH